MAAKGKATKPRRKRSQKKNNGIVQRKDRLSSLPDDILIGILSLLSLPLAVTTEFLSSRWRGLWTNTTSIDMTYRELNINKHKSKNHIANFLDKIRMQITSPFIHSFRLGFLGMSLNYSCWRPCLESWIHHICDRNVRELRLTRSSYGWFNGVVVTLPSVIFQTRSLVSVELVLFHTWKLRDDAEPIELPNLKNLKFSLCSPNCEWVQKQIKACPSLEKLSIECYDYDYDYRLRKLSVSYEDYIKFSNHNLRSLVILFGIHLKVAINAPKLEYLAITAPNLETFWFDEQPSMLCEAKIETTAGPSYAIVDKNSMSKFYGAISKSRSLALDVFVLDNLLSSMFCNATQLTIDMKPNRSWHCIKRITRFGHDITTVSSLLHLFPVLDVLTLKFSDLNGYQWHWVLPAKPSHISTLRRVRMRIQIKIYRYNYNDLVEAFSELIEYLLSNDVNLEHFKVNTVLNDSEDVVKEQLELRQRKELRFVKLLYHCLTLIGCELEFQGRFYKTSRKAWSLNGKVLPLTYAEKCMETVII